VIDFNLIGYVQADGLSQLIAAVYLDKLCALADSAMKNIC
jgi:hypothetical protein